jgi:REP element-mobilizing transposase RayT
VSHAKRAPHRKDEPMHVVVRLVEGLPSLRQEREYQVVLEAFRRCKERDSFRITQYSVLSNHVHMIIEAADQERLSRGMQGLLISLAKRLGKLWGHVGQVFSDRFFSRALRGPREVRNALVYVLNNARRHGVKLDWSCPDPFSSGRWHDGWSDFIAETCSSLLLPVSAACTWLLTKGWRCHGLPSVASVPGP